jgi:hypothetical protein
METRVYPVAFSGFLAPEIDPGTLQQSPPLTTLTKLRLKPGAIYRLKTGTHLGYAMENRQRPLPPAVAIAIGPNQDLQEPARTTLIHKPVEALVTWHLHTTNGTAWDLKAEERTWPAKGGWSGILETAPIKVTLAE